MILVEIAGFLGADAEERSTSSGKRVVSLRMATKVRAGGKDETVWWRVNIWNDRYDKMIPYLRKGTALIIVGEMGKPETYVDKEGRTQISLNLSAEIIKFSPFGKPEKGESTGGGEKPTYGSRENAEESISVGAGAMSDYAGDDLPF